MLFQIRPKVSISPQIARDTNPKTLEEVFVFKVINKSALFKIYDLKCSLHVYEKIPSHNAEDLKKTDDKVELINDNYWVLERFNIRHVSQILNKHKKLKTRTDYAAQFGTKYDLERVIRQRKIVILQVYAKHPLSGFSKVKNEEFKHISQMIKGSFCSGNLFLIKP